MSFSNYLELKVLDHLMGKASYSAPTIYVGLSTADPLDDGSGLAEPSGNGYARVLTAAGNWNSAASGTITNLSTITFPEASGSWGTVSHVVLFDADTGGNILGSGALSAPTAIVALNIPRFSAGQLSVSLD